MARVCKNPYLESTYLDQIQKRNTVEKNIYRDVFTEYMELMQENKELEEKFK